VLIFLKAGDYRIDLLLFASGNTTEIVLNDVVICFGYSAGSYGSLSAMNIVYHIPDNAKLKVSYNNDDFAGRAGSTFLSLQRLR
jgi:hypothetical protein